MSRTTVKVVSVISDISKEEADAVIKFSYGGTSYSIDATQGELAEFERVIEPYTSIAHTSKRQGADGDAAKIREWANAQHPPIQVAERGRIPAELRERWEEATKDTAGTDATEATAETPEAAAVASPESVPEFAFAAPGVGS